MEPRNRMFKTYSKRRRREPLHRSIIVLLKQGTEYLYENVLNLYDTYPQRRTQTWRDSEIYIGLLIL